MRRAIDIELHQTGGGSTFPSALHQRECAACGVMCLMSQMVQETNEQSPAFGKMVHVFCWDGPVPDPPVIRIGEELQKRRPRP